MGGGWGAHQNGWQPRGTRGAGGAAHGEPVQNDASGRNESRFGLGLEPSRLMERIRAPSAMESAHTTSLLLLLIMGTPGTAADA